MFYQLQTGIKNLYDSLQPVLCLQKPQSVSLYHVLTLEAYMLFYERGTLSQGQYILKRLKDNYYAYILH